MAQDLHKGMSIFARLLSAFVGVTIGVCGLLLVALYGFTKQTMELRTTEQIAQHLATMHARFVHEYGAIVTGALRALSSSVVLDDYLMSSQVEHLITAKKVEQVFRHMLHENESLQSIVFVDHRYDVTLRGTDVQLVRASRPRGAGPRGSEGAEMAAYQDATTRLLHHLASQPPGAIHIEGPFIAADETVAFVAGISKLDLDTGELAGMVVIHHRLDAFFATLDAVTFFGENPLWVFTPEGRLLRQPAQESATFDPRASLLPAQQLEPRVLPVRQGLVAYQDFALLAGQPFVRVAFSIPTSLLLKDLRPMVQFFSLVFGLALLVVLALAFFLSRYLSKPIVELAGAARRLAQGDLTTQVTVRTTGEVQILVESFNRMVENLNRSEQELKTHRDDLQALVQERTAELEGTHRALVDTARQAGMAEVATDVLHNVGNVLNSVGVTTASITKMLRNSKTSYLSNVVQALEDHADELGTFLTTDDRGRRIPAFLAEVSGNLTAEQAHLLEAVEKLTGHVQHITEIVNLQQSYGKIAALSEPALLSELVEDAVRINGDALIRHDIEVTREYAQLPSALFDRSKVLQIMTNLISNTKYALSQNGREKKRLTLRIKEPQDGRVQIEVADNGVGIAEDNLTRIFGYGFTTRKDGHGFGLHSGALAAKEMEGSLTAHSDGPDQGAVFTLVLPFKRAKCKHAS